MRYLSLLLVLAACSDANGPSASSENFAIINRSTEPATVVLHQTDWNGSVWTPRTDTAFALTVQPGVRTCVLLNFAAVSGTVAMPADTFALSEFGLSNANPWTVTVVIDAGPSVARAARSRGEGCTP